MVNTILEALQPSLGVTLTCLLALLLVYKGWRVFLSFWR